MCIKVDVKMNTIRVALVYSSGFERLNGRHPITSHYHFYTRALSRNKRLEITYFDALGRIDVAKLEKDHDVVLLPEINLAVSLSLPGIKDSNIPVIGDPRDPHGVFTRDMMGLTSRLKIDWFFSMYSPEAFYEYYPRRFKYGTVHIGVEPSLCESEIPWTARTSNRIALSGALGRTGIMRMLYYRGYLRLPKVLTPDFHYKLRTKCNKLPYVVHTQEIYPSQGTDQLHRVLSGFRAAIAATTTHQTAKYKETPAAGCLTFMEVTNKNHGVSHLGYEDGKSAVFIDDTNYKAKFQEYLDSADDPRWKKIAQAGRRHTLENLSNDKGVEMLIQIMRKALGNEGA